MEEFKVHVNQMTQQEKELVKSKIRIKGEPQLTGYCMARMAQRGIKNWQIKRTIQLGEIVEYHYVNNLQQRALIRGKANRRGNVTCVVVDLFTKEVITAYYNNVDDMHYSLNKDNYDGEQDIFRLITVGGMRNVQASHRKRNSNSTPIKTP